MRRRIALALLSLWPVLALTGGMLRASPVRASSTDLSDRYEELLLEYTAPVSRVVQTRVDYRGLARETRWRELVVRLSRSDPQMLGTRAEKLAYWINAYNILAIEVVLQHYPLDSIKDAGGLFSPVWGRPAGSIGGRTYSLGEIEHEILRPMGEPRIHAAIVCASISCPPLRREPYRAEVLDAQLDAASAAWLANSDKGARLSREKATLHVSRVFDWFAGDFGGDSGVVAYVGRYLSDADARWLEAHRESVRLEYLPYDWRLNE